MRSLVLLLMLCACSGPMKASPWGEAELFDHSGLGRNSWAAAGVRLTDERGRYFEIGPAARFDLGRWEEEARFGAVIRFGGGR